MARRFRSNKNSHHSSEESRLSTTGTIVVIVVAILVAALCFIIPFSIRLMCRRKLANRRFQQGQVGMMMDNNNNMQGQPGMMMNSNYNVQMQGQPQKMNTQGQDQMPASAYPRQQYEPLPIQPPPQPEPI